MNESDVLLAERLGIADELLADDQQDLDPGDTASADGIDGGGHERRPGVVEESGGRDHD